MRVRTFLFLSSVYCATVSVLDVCDMCFNFLTVYFSLSQKKTVFLKDQSWLRNRNTDHFSYELTLCILKDGYYSWEWDDTSKAAILTLTAHTARILINATISNNVLLLCQVLYIYYALLSLYHNPLQNVPYSDSTQSLLWFSLQKPLLRN